MEYFIEKEPSQDTINQIVSIAQDYVSDYFTSNVPDAIRSDLQFQRTIYLKNGSEIVSFIVFTCLDGSPHITLMATRRNYCGSGYGKLLMQYFVNHVTDLGFDSIELFTVLPQSKPVYFSTVAFYQKNGFKIEKEYPDLWESGAIKMRKCWYSATKTTFMLV